MPRFVANEVQVGSLPTTRSKMQVKCYGSTLGFHPSGVGSTPITRTDMLPATVDAPFRTRCRLGSTPSGSTMLA